MYTKQSREYNLDSSVAENGKGPHTFKLLSLKLRIDDGGYIETTTKDVAEKTGIDISIIENVISISTPDTYKACEGYGVEFNYEVSDDCGNKTISRFWITANGSQYQTPGCTDPEACNYDSSATCDDGSCTYIPAGDCDCFGNKLDCAGVCGGSAKEDSCGECSKLENGSNNPNYGLGPDDCGFCPSDSNYKGDKDVCGRCPGDENYGDQITCNDGTKVCKEEDCPPDKVFGCTRRSACNFDVNATDDDGSCLDFDDCNDCGGDVFLGNLTPENEGKRCDCEDKSLVVTKCPDGKGGHFWYCGQCPENDGNEFGNPDQNDEFDNHDLVNQQDQNPSGTVHVVQQEVETVAPQSTEWAQASDVQLNEAQPTATVAAATVSTSTPEIN